MPIKFDLFMLLIPIIGLLIGWVTNYLAVKMLFHPREPLNLTFFKLQGVFPKRQQAFAEKLGSIVSNELFSAEDVKKVLNEGVESEELKLAIEKQLDVIITERLPAAIPMLAMVMNPDLVSTVKRAFMAEMQPFLKSLVDVMGDRIDNDLDVHQIVEEKVANFSSDKLEEILFAIMKREFRFIELVGAVLGFLIGVAQLLLLEFKPELKALIADVLTMSGLN